MPKLTNHIFALTTEDKQRHHFESEIHVSTEGEFSCTVPDYLIPALDVIAKAENTFSKKLKTEKLKVNYRAYAPSKAELLRFVEKAHEQHHKAVVTTDLIICYDCFAEVNYWLNPDGSMAANGSMPDAVRSKDDGTGGKWADNLRKEGGHISATDTIKHFSVGVYANIFKRRTHTRISGVTVTWERILHAEGKNPEDEWMNKLTGLCGLATPKSPEYLKQMPYTPEAAKFFYESMMAMCEIGRRFKGFFGDEANVIAAIEGHGPSLLSAPTSASQLPALPSE
ncbi:hypothetical protein V0M98_34650 (plasmid) [Pseudomonas silesiensis]|uniref:hypothetical protein n=1 Tax=Pseudomonas silesiensis TaxID=1853130 RepID=UPI0030CFCB31